MPAELISKPKGMHWRAFNRKIDQIKQVDNCALADIGALLASIELVTNRVMAKLPSVS
jgi:uncharacterized protein YjiS (DUF1127 family)